MITSLRVCRANPRHDGIVGVENCRPTSVGGGGRVQQIEQAALRPPIALDAAVKVQVLVGHVGDNCAVEAEAVHALELERVRGHFEHRPIGARIHELAQLPGNHRRLGGGETPSGRQPFAGEPRAHGGHGARRAPLRLEHRRDQVARCGLAVGTRHANRAQREIGLAPETPGQRGQRRPAVRHERQPHVRGNLNGTLGHHGHRAGGDGRGNVGVAVVAQSSPGDEAGAGADLA